MSLVKRYSKQLIGFAGFSSLLVLWQLAGFLNILPKFVLPTPLEIGNAFVRDRALLIHNSLSTPLGPRIETISPFCTSSDTLFKTALSPKEKLTSFTVKISVTYQFVCKTFVF